MDQSRHRRDAIGSQSEGDNEMAENLQFNAAEGMAALGICESLLLALTELKIVTEQDTRDLLTDVATTHQEAAIASLHLYVSDLCWNGAPDGVPDGRIDAPQNFPIGGADVADEGDLGFEDQSKRTGNQLDRLCGRSLSEQR